MSNLAKVTLNIRLIETGGAYLITVYDNAYRSLASGSGNLSVDLAPGIYKVQASVGRQNWETLAVLQPGSQPTLVEVPVLSINSPVPLNDTAQHHEYHEKAANEHSHKIHVQAGKGSAIFLFARSFGQIARDSSGQPVHPFTGLTLLNASGANVADLQALGATLSAQDAALGKDPWAACNIALDPGDYRLRLELPSGDQVEQPLYAARNWQIQVFALLAPFGAQPADVRANLVEAAISYRPFNPADPARSVGFDPRVPEEAESYRLTELARQGLLEKRAILKEETRSMLWEKFGNPMLGILGGHLLLMEKTPDLVLLALVVGNLRSMLDHHPDVEALALPLKEPNASYLFTSMPMLRKSWQQVLKASIRRPEIVPIDSEASLLSNHLWGEGLWMFTTVKPVEAAVNATVMVQSIINQQPQPVTLTPYESAAVNSLAASAPWLQTSGIRKDPDYGEGANTSFGLPIDEVVPVNKTAGPPEMDDATAERMVNELGVPRGNVELFLQRATDKARMYEATRTAMQPSYQRTRLMNRILNEIHTAARSDQEDAAQSIKRLIRENSDGSRITAIGILQVAPRPDAFSFVLDAIGNSRSAFEQYQALSSSRTYLPSLTGEQKEQLKAVIESQRGDQPNQYIKPGSDRWVLSDIILRDL